MCSAAQKGSGGVIGVAGTHVDLWVRDQTYLIENIVLILGDGLLRYSVALDREKLRPVWVH